MVDTQATPTTDAPVTTAPIKSAPTSNKPRTATIKRFSPDGKDAGTVTVTLRDRVRTELRDGKAIQVPDPVKFMRDNGNTNPDGSPCYIEYGEDYAEAACPKCGYDVAHVVPAGLKCSSCHTIFSAA